MPEAVVHNDSLPAHVASMVHKPAVRTTATDTLSVQIPATDSLPGADTPAAAPAESADWTSVLPPPMSRAADSHFTYPAAPIFREASPESIFGAHSTTVPARPLPTAEAPSLTDNPVFQGFVLLLAATYAMLLYHNLGDIRQLLGRITRDTATGQRLSEDPGGSGFLNFLNIATTIGMLFMGVMAVKYGDSLMPASFLRAVPHGAVLGLSLLTTMACSTVVLYQWFAFRLAGAITLSQPLVSQLLLLKRTYFSLTVIVASPVLLLFALCPRGTGNVWFYVVAVELTITAILYLKETLNLFLSKKISILHWFLYLCIIEIFPLSLLYLLAVR